MRRWVMALVWEKVREKVREKVMVPARKNGNTKDHCMGLGSLAPNNSLMTRNLIDRPHSSHNLT